jgi:nucleotide-binding universal stress UspA family protein
MKRFQRILVSVDTRREDHPPLTWAKLLAEHTGASLTLVDVVPAFSWPMRLAMRDHAHVTELLLQEKQEKLDALADPLKKKGLQVDTKVFSGRSSNEIIRQVLRGKHDLVVCLPKGATSRREGMLGTTALQLLRRCPCPVWVAKPESHPKLRHILVAVDPVPHDVARSELNDALLELGKAISAAEKCRLSVLHAWSIYGESMLRSRLVESDFREIEKNTRTEIERAFEELLARHGMKIADDNVHFVKAEAAQAMAQLTAGGDVDLLLIGTTARSGVAGALMGNTAEKIVDQVPCSILALKPKGFESPVTLEKS